MKNKDFAELSRRLLPYLPGFTVKAPMMFIAPVVHTLRGLYFESHSYDAELFYVWAFFLPLCIPRKHVSFEFGKRIGVDRWDIGQPDLVPKLSSAIHDEGLPLFLNVESPSDLVQAAKALGLPQNLRVEQSIAFALARAGAIDEAIVALETHLRVLDPRVPWQLEIAEQADLLKLKLQTDVCSAMQQLQIWEAESIRNLGLEKCQ